MLAQCRPALMVLLLMTLVTGAAYPLLVTAVGQTLFHAQANGSLLRDGAGQVVGSQLIAQRFDGDEWFWSRPSAGDFATVASAASNLSQTNPALVERITTEVSRLGGSASAPVPLALVTTSGSGLDPDLPLEAVRYQMARVAEARGLPIAELETLLAPLVQRTPISGPVVNVLALNRALAETTSGSLSMRAP